MSWLQYWLAPRLQIDASEADWWIVIGATDRPPAGSEITHRFGDDLLVRRR